MTLVRIIKTWDKPDLLRQTPGGAGVWDGIRFTLEPVSACDYAVVLQKLPAPTTLRCAPERVWAVMEEPPNEAFKAEHRGPRGVGRVYTCDPSLRWRGPRFTATHPALPWHVGRSYDELMQAPPPEKPRALSWITSNLAVFQGHHARLNFLRRIQGRLEFDLYGRGFSFIDDKWDGLAPYRYALAVENYSNSLYWSEKLFDCFLAWTMPIYYGCTEITRFFPAEAMVQIDIDDPDVVDKIREAVASDRWRRNRDAIAHARELVLNRYQLFPFLARAIHAHEARRPGAPAPRELTLTNEPRPIDALEARARHLVGRHVTRPLRTAWAALRQKAGPAGGRP
jgi:hypothetical protein